MSSRALKRLMRDELLANINGAELGDEEEVEGDDRAGNNNNKRETENLFELLSGQDEENADEEDKEEDVSDDDQSTQRPDRSQATNKKKKKKKINKKEKETENPLVQETVDDVEVSLQEVNRILGDPGRASMEPNITFSASVKPLLHIDYRHLNPETELKRIFDAKIFRGKQPPSPHNAPAGCRRNRRQRIFRGEQPPRNRRQRNQPVQRSSRLVQFKDTWPSSRGSGLSMQYIEQTQEFVFKHSPAYQKVQTRFVDSVESIIADNILDIMRETPYHVDMLMLVATGSEIFQDYEQAETCIERALYVSECVFHPLFNLASGNCYLNYQRAENRGFFVCLFRHILNLGRKRCNRTAFEFCKLLLSLDPVGDPLDCMSMIDYYALRSEQYDYLIQLEREVKVHDSMRQVPNFAMSIPLAHFKIARRDAGDTTTADEKLQDSLLFFPVMVIPLLDECRVRPNKRVSSHPFFSQVELEDFNSELGNLVTLYVTRCKPCWKKAEVIAWLKHNVMTVLDIVDRGTDPRIKKYAKMRSQLFKHTPLRLLRHYNLSKIPILMARKEHLRGTSFDYDPFPPADTIRAYTITPRFLSYDPSPPLDTIRAYTITPRPTVVSQDQSGFFRLLLRSLRPSYNPNEPIDEALRRQDDADVAAATQGIPQQIHQSVKAVFQAMRRLINYIFICRRGTSRCRQPSTRGQQ